MFSRFNSDIFQVFSEFNSDILRILNSFPFLDGFMLFVSYNFDSFLFLILALLFFRRGKAEALLYLFLLLAAWGLSNALKLIFAVPRPDDVRFVTCATGYSMPSGHALLSFASAVFLHPKAGYLKPLVWIFAILVSLSRIFIGVHYPSDVLAGAILGSLLGFFWLWLENKLKKKV